MNIDRIAEYVWIGKQYQHWYADCQKLFEKHFGEEQLPLITKLFAATSINTSLKANVSLFRKALYEIQNNLPVGKYLPNIQAQLEKIRAGQELSGRKISSFARAMSGDKDAVVVDIWLLRAFGMDRKYLRHTGPYKGLMRDGGATDKQYTTIEAWVRDKAKSMGLEARELSAILWAGTRIQHSGDKGTHYKELLDYSLNNLFGCI